MIAKYLPLTSQLLVLISSRASSLTQLPAEEAVQDKLASVVAAPECIWRALEQKQVSVAASSYLAARDTYHSLSEAAKHASSLPLANAWQVLQELHLQVASLILFKLLTSC